MESQEKRKFRRRKVETPAWIFSDKGTFVQGTTDNFSMGGAFVIAGSLSGKLDAGSVLNIKIGCPDDTGTALVPQTVSCLSEVMRIQRTNGRAGVALKFVSELVAD